MRISVAPNFVHEYEAHISSSRFWAEAGDNIRDSISAEEIYEKLI